MIIYVLIVVLLFVFALIIKMCRRLLYDDFVLNSSDEDFVKYIEKMAEKHKLPEKHGKGIDISLLKPYIKKGHRVITKKVQLGNNLFEYEKWLYDNHYIFMRMLNRKSYDNFFTLPHVDNIPRVVTLARSIVAYSNCKVTKHRVELALETAEKIAPLTFMEICVFEDALVYALLEKVANISRKCIYYQKMFRTAVKAKNLVRRYLKSNLYTYFTIKNNPKLSGKLKDYLDKNDIDYDNIDYTFTSLIIENNVLTQNMVESLQKIDDLTRTAINYLPVYSVLETDKVFQKMDMSTKFIYLNKISELSDKANLSEKEFVRRLFEFQKIKKLHFGNLLFYHEKETMQYISKQVVVDLKPKKPVAEIIYFSLVIALTIGASITVAYFARYWWAGLIVFFLSLFAFLKPVTNIVNSLAKGLIKTKNVFRMNYASIPDSAKTMVIVPVFIPNKAELKKNIRHIKELASVNVDKNAEFVLLIDFKASDNAIDNGDNALIDILKSKLKDSQSVSAVVRKRTKCGNKYMGFERKRGAIEAFNEFLITGDKSKIAYQTKEYEKPKFCIVLDSDNTIAPQSVLELVNTFLHPMYDNFDLLALDSRYNLYSINTLYSKQFIRDGGLENYPEYSAFYFNLTGLAIFQGKGIYKLENFYNKLNNCLPENKVLSHDIIEGAILNTGRAGTVTYEDAPSNFISDVSRKTRWMRGDIQLLPFINFKKTCDNNNKIPVFYRFIMFLNAMFVRFEPMVFGMLLLGYFANDWVISLSAVLAIATQFILLIIGSIMSISKNRCGLYLLKDLIFYVLDFFKTLFLLPFYAFYNLYIFCGTLFRMLITKKGLLNWKTYSMAENESPKGQYAKFFAPSLVIMTGIFALSYVYNYINYFWYALSYYCLMLVSYGIVILSGKREQKRKIKNDNLFDIAKRTYKYFEEFNNDGLIADNFQYYPKGETDKRTSPTNIGFSILANISASELGIITKEDAETKTKEILTATSKLKKWNGHLYNWYDIKTKKPMKPFFVSSVDSGNYIASLIVAKGYFGGEIKQKIDDYLKTVKLKKLYDEGKQQFYIGYNQSAKKFEGHYDNLISEARLLNYLGIAFGINVSSWYSLSRDLTSLYGNTLLSWSGTAFEYLMAELFLDTPKYSLLGKSINHAVMAFKSTKCQGLWGISESGHFELDDMKNYKYYAFGIDKLALRSEINWCVVSPYSTFLAMPYDYSGAVKNLQNLNKMDMRNEYGYFEALDLTGQPRIALEYMAHHQGMILCSLANLLCDNVIKKAFFKDINVSGARPLLCERNIEIRGENRKKNKFVYKDSGNENFEREVPKNLLFPCFNVLKCDNYNVVIDDFGRGYSTWNDIYINRFRRDMYRDFGGFFYCIDKETGNCSSPTRAPLNTDGDYKIIYRKNECIYENGNFKMNVYNPNFFNGEMRRLTIKNETNKDKSYKIAYYTELCMTDIDSDYSHQAFNNLFVETKLIEDNIIAERKYLSEGKKLYLSFIVKGANKIRYITNRFNFIGRGNSPKNPVGLKESAPKSDDIGTVLDPCFAFIGKVTVPARGKTEVDVIIGMADTYEKIQIQNKRARSQHFSEFIKKIPYIVENNAILTLDDNHTKLLQNLIGKLLYEPYRKTKLLGICKNHSDFVKLSENYNRKILLYRHKSNETHKLMQKIIMANTLNSIGIKVALIISYCESDSYYEFVKKEILNNVKNGVIGQEIIMVEENEIPYSVLESFAYYDFQELNLSLNTGTECKCLPLKKINIVSEKFLESGEGYFAENGYVVSPINKKTMLPYSNIICGEYGGTLVTDNGGYTYCENSRENKLTAWSNDAVEDTPSEWLYFVNKKGCYRLNGEKNTVITHTQGMTTMLSKLPDVTARVEQYIIDDGKYKVYEVDLYAMEDIAGELILNLDLILGWKETPEYIMYDTKGDMINSINILNGSKISLKVFGGEYITDKNRIYSRTSNRAFNPCEPIFYNPSFAAKYEVGLKSGENRKFYFIFGQDGENLKNIDLLIIKDKKNDALNYFESLNKFNIKSGNTALDLLFNDWLMYQVVSCRINGRTAFYQAGGAIGFRDQLQDCLALIYSDAERAKNLILNIAKHTYVEGDVMHWWHGEKHGVRTRITDDRLFLPYVISEYIEKTGDKAILDIELPYLFSAPLKQYEKSRYEEPKYTVNPEKLSTHLERIIDSVYHIGENGLLLMHGGDWNDALDCVGDDTKGESVWLTMFYYDVLNRMQNFYTGKEKMAWIARMDKLKRAIERTFTGKQYKRLITKDGEWLGDGKSDNMEIDIISQAWASLSDMCDMENVNIALNTAKSKLFDEKNGLIKLLWPPFDDKKYYGYITSYPKGIRENGGQYTHGAIWFLMALVKENRVDEAFEIFNAINPIAKCTKPENVIKYKAEPYVLSADVYTNDLNQGRAGWSWYTGSASWCYKLILEGFLGIKLKNGNLEVRPHLPADLKRVEVDYKYKNSNYHITIVKNGREGFFENGMEIKNGNKIYLAENCHRNFVVYSP